MLKNRKLFLLAIALVFFIFPWDSSGQNVDRLEIGGAFMGVFNYFQQTDQTTIDPKRQQFDLAVNLDFVWIIRPNIRTYIQLQSGPGLVSIGFAGPGVALTDLNVEIDLNKSFALTVGSFDTPFCLETQYLTNNGDGFTNRLFLNSLFYSALAGTNVGTLNTVGIKGLFHYRYGQVIAAFTNGTDETAFNPDGNFEFVASGCVKDLIPKLHLVGSFISSGDKSAAGSSGMNAKYRGYILDSRYNFSDRFYVWGNYGQFTYNDNLAETPDGVRVWKTEASYGKKQWHIAGRISAWQPEKMKCKMSVPSRVIPNPGLGVDQMKIRLSSGQPIYRSQLTFSWYFDTKMLFKCELFSDSYRETPLTESTGVQGMIMALNVKL